MYKGNEFMYIAFQSEYSRFIYVQHQFMYITDLDSLFDSD